METLRVSVCKIARGCGSHFDPVVAEAFLRIPLARLEEINRHYEHLTSGGAMGTPALAQAN